MDDSLNILLVEDNEDDAKLVKRHLERGGLEANLRRVETEGAMNAALNEREWDAVISDFSLPLFTGMGALAVVRKRGLDMPFILVSGTVTDDTAVAAMKAGANDYLLKNNLSRLAPALIREIKEAIARQAYWRATVAEREKLQSRVNEQKDQLAVIAAQLKTSNAMTEEAVRTKDKFLSRIGQELRNPVLAMIQHAEKLADFEASKEEQMARIKTIQENGERLLDVVNWLVSSWNEENDSSATEPRSFFPIVRAKVA